MAIPKSYFVVITSLLTSLLFTPITHTQSLPNPIYKNYPTLPTGTLNLTISVIPIPLHLAYTLIPPQYTILTTAYLSLLPSTWDPALYPLILETRFDHDIYYQNISGAIPDFQGVQVLFPFVDRLGDGTSFVFGNRTVISRGQEAAVLGSRTYGFFVEEARFVPEGEGYAFFEGRGGLDGERIVRAFVNSSCGEDTEREELVAQVRFVDEEVMTFGCNYGIDFYKNITNQPVFSNNISVCDNQVVFWNTTVSTSTNSPVNITSRVFLGDSLFPGGLRRAGVPGVRVDTAWYERNYLDCEMLSGYSGEEGD